MAKKMSEARALIPDIILSFGGMMSMYACTIAFWRSLETAFARRPESAWSIDEVGLPSAAPVRHREGEALGAPHSKLQALAKEFQRFAGQCSIRDGPH